MFLPHAQAQQPKAPFWAPAGQPKPAVVPAQARILPDTLPPPNAVKDKAQPSTPAGPPTVIYPHQPKIIRTGAQAAPRAEVEDVGFVLDTKFPGPQVLFRRDSESELFQRIRQEASQKPGAAKVYFPDEKPITTQKYQPRHFPLCAKLVEPAYVNHNRLLFEQRNWERHGWEIGPLQPGICLAEFYYDMFMLPYHVWTRPGDRMETSAGKCLPGDPVPLLLYPEEFSVTGLLGMAGTYTALPFIFP